MALVGDLTCAISDGQAQVLQHSNAQMVCGHFSWFCFFVSLVFAFVGSGGGDAVLCKRVGKRRRLGSSAFSPFSLKRHYKKKNYLCLFLPVYVFLEYVLWEVMGSTKDDTWFLYLLGVMLVCNCCGWLLCVEYTAHGITDFVVELSKFLSELKDDNTFLFSFVFCFPPFLSAISHVSCAIPDFSTVVDTQLTCWPFQGQILSMFCCSPNESQIGIAPALTVQIDGFSVDDKASVVSPLMIALNKYFSIEQQL